MAKLTQDRTDIQWSQGVNYRFKVAADQTIYRGALVMINAAGYLEDADDMTANLQCIGFAVEGIKTGSTRSDDDEIMVRMDGTIKLTWNNNTAATQAVVGDFAYAEDDQSVDVVGQTTNDIKVGRIIDVIDSGKAVIVRLSDKSD